MGRTNLELLLFAKRLKLSHFRGVFSIDTLPRKIWSRESGIINLARSTLHGSHWVAYFKRGLYRVYFDSFGVITPQPIQRYLKTRREFEKKIKCIERSTQQIQKFNSELCGEFCLFALYNLSKLKNHSYDRVIELVSDHGYFRRFCDSLNRT